MTLILELPAEVEAELQAAAAARGEDVQTFVVALVRERAAHERNLNREQRRQRIEKALEESRIALAPLYAHSDDPIAELLAEKHADVSRENARWEQAES